MKIRNKVMSLTLATTMLSMTVAPVMAAPTPIDSYMSSNQINSAIEGLESVIGQGSISGILDGIMGGLDEIIQNGEDIFADPDGVVELLPFTILEGQEENLLVIIQKMIGQDKVVTLRDVEGSGNKQFVITSSNGDEYVAKIEIVTIERNEAAILPERHWAREHAKLAVDKGYIKGLVDGELNLDANLTNGEAATVVNRILLSNNVSFKSQSRDMVDQVELTGSQWSAPAYKSLLSRFSDDSLKRTQSVDLKKSITREEVAQLIYDSLQGHQFSGTQIERTYNDESSVSNTDAMKYVTSIGLFQGDDNGNFSPKSNIKRSEFMAVLNRLDSTIISNAILDVK